MDIGQYDAYDRRSAALAKQAKALESKAWVSGRPIKLPVLKVCGGLAMSSTQGAWGYLPPGGVGTSAQGVWVPSPRVPGHLPTGGVGITQTVPAGLPTRSSLPLPPQPELHPNRPALRVIQEKQEAARQRLHGSSSAATGASGPRRGLTLIKTGY